MRSLFVATLLLACLAGEGRAQYGVSASDVVQHLRATYYDCKEKGQCSAHKRTASGTPFNPAAMTCAMRRPMPLGAYVRVCFGDRCAVCRVNDRGPAAWTGNGIDLTPAMKNAIGLPGRGAVKVQRVR
jgi:rare lipoprotein A (peptidoglycan hydrolase)